MGSIISVSDYKGSIIQKSIELSYGESLEKAGDEKQKKVKKVMDEWKSGKLKSSSGDKVTDQKQAIAIAMSEAGLSKADIEELTKGGEGSRGGRVIGHTKSGQPIYAGGNNHEDYSKQDHEDAAKAHRGEAEKNSKYMATAGEKAVHEGHAKRHDEMAKTAKEGHKQLEKEDKFDSEFENHAGKIKKAIDDNFEKGLIDPLTYLKANVQLSNIIEKASGGEGSRGGKVIGHTKSGKAIYDHFGHSGHNGFTSDEHRDAAERHSAIGHKHAGIEAAYNVLHHQESKTDKEKQYTKEVSETHANAKQHHYINADIHREHANIMDAEKNKEHLANKLKGRHGYIGFTHKGERVEVYADSQYDAIKQIRESHKVPKSKEHLVHAHLAEKNVDPATGRGEQVTHIADF